MPVYRHTTAQGHHASSKASKTRITSGTAAVAVPLVSISAYAERKTRAEFGKEN